MYKMKSPMGYNNGIPFADSLSQQPGETEEEYQQRLQAQRLPSYEEPEKEPTPGEVLGQGVQTYALTKGIDKTAGAFSDTVSPQLTALKAQTFGLSPEQSMDAFKTLSMKDQTEALASAQKAVTEGTAESVGEGLAKTGEQTAVKAATDLGSSALSSFGGAAVGDLIARGKIDEKTALKGAAAMGANMLIPGSGILVGPLMSALGLQSGTNNVPSNNQIIMEAQKELPPLMKGALSVADAYRKFQEDQMPVGKFGNVKISGGKSKVNFDTDLGKFEVDHKNKGVKFSKTFSFEEGTNKVPAPLEKTSDPFMKELEIKDKVKSQVESGYFGDLQGKTRERAINDYENKLRQEQGLQPKEFKYSPAG